MEEQMYYTAQLPNERMFQFWETQQKYDREIHVDNKNPQASDKKDGTAKNRSKRSTLPLRQQHRERGC